MSPSNFLLDLDRWGGTFTSKSFGPIAAQKMQGEGTTRVNVQALTVLQILLCTLRSVFSNVIFIDLKSIF